MSLPLVSVIVPIYNRAKRSIATLQSIIAQDYENLEIIVVDDGSTDNSSEVAEEVLKNSGRVFKNIRYEKNRGVSAARNVGLEAAEGKYVCFCDSDDLLKKNFVSSLCKEAEEKNADLVFCEYQHYYEKENRFEPRHMFKTKFIPASNKYLLAWTKKQITLLTVWNFIYKKEFLQEHSLKFCEALPVCEDVEFSHKVMACASNVSYVNDILYTYMIHYSDQISVEYGRNEIRMARYGALALWRAGRCILRQTNDKSIKNYIFHVFIINAFIMQLTLSAEHGDRAYYDLKLKNLKHKKMRRIILSSIKYFFTDPEIFFKALMVLYCPNFYYRLRSKK